MFRRSRCHECMGDTRRILCAQQRVPRLYGSSGFKAQVSKLVFKTPKKCRFLVNCICTLAPDAQNTRRARRTRWLPVAECCDETTCLRTNVLTGRKSTPRPDTTESKTPQVELQRTPQPTSDNLKRATNRRNQKATAAEQPRAPQSKLH